MKHKRSHGDKGFLSFIHKNAPLVSGLAAVILTVLFVSTIILSGNSGSLRRPPVSQAAYDVIAAEAKCLSPGEIQVAIRAPSGVDHYSISGLQELAVQKPVIFGPVTTKDTNYTAKDPDFIGRDIKMQITAFDAGDRPLYGPVISNQVTCPSAPLSTSHFESAICEGGRASFRWTPQTGADHYMLEIFKSNGPRIFGPYDWVSDTSYTAVDPDLVNGDFIADIYPRDALNQRIAGPVYSNLFTCSSSAAQSWNIGVQAVCPNGNIPSAMVGVVNTRWRPAPYFVDGKEVGYKDGGTMSSTGLSVITAPVINQTLNWYAYMSYRSPDGTTQPTLKPYGSMPDPGMSVYEDDGSNLRYQIKWNNTLPVKSYTVRMQLPLSAPECRGTINLGDLRAVCPRSGEMQLSWRPQSGAHHYAVEVSKRVNGSNTNVFPLTNVSETYYTAKDADFVGGSTYVADVYARNALDQNIAGPVYSSPVTCPADPPLSCVNKDLMMVMDTSGSMSGSKLANAKLAAKALLSKLPSGAGARAGMVGFGSHAYTVSALTSTMSNVSQSVNNLRATGGTNLAEGISYGNGRFSVDNKTHVILLLTDGIANLPRDAGVGPNDPAAYVSAQAAATDEVQAGITKGLKTVFYSVGLGKKSQLNAAWLDTLTSGTGGRSVYASNSEDLDNLFTSLASDICKETPSNAGSNLIGTLRRTAPPRP